MNHVSIIGFGSQASAWAQCLKISGFHVSIFLRTRGGSSFDRALECGFTPELVEDLPTAIERTKSKTPHLIAMLCPDDAIGALYREYLARLSTPLTLVLAHGYAVYSESLKTLNKNHEVTLLAPKAIGPKLLSNFKAAHPAPHSLVAAFFAPESKRTQLTTLATGLGFAASNLVNATFAEETIGDLISEQGLLCGGVFSLLEWTMQNMSRAGIPDRLIREECLTELELIAGMLREKGPRDTFVAISQAAQCGAVLMQKKLQDAHVDDVLKTQAEAVTNGTFTKEMNKGHWKEDARQWTQRLQEWQERLIKK